MVAFAFLVMMSIWHSHDKSSMGDGDSQILNAWSVDLSVV